MKKAIAFMIMACALATFTSCSNSSKTQTEESAPAVEILTVDDLLSQASELVDSTVTFEGVCSHTCKHGATKMFVLGSDDTKTIRVEACSLGSFDNKCIHRPVTVTGVLREQRIDEDYLAQWEEKLKAQVAADNTHGENGEGSCDSEKAARGVTSDSAEGQIAEYRARIAERQANEGKNYLSFYYIEAEAYEIGE